MMGEREKASFISASFMEMGEGGKALRPENHDRKAFSELPEASKGEHCMIGDGGFVKLPEEVHCVRQEGGFGSRGAFVGDGEKALFEVGGADRDVGCALRNVTHTHMLEELHQVGYASRRFCIVGDCHKTSSLDEDYPQSGQGRLKAECTSSFNALAQLPCQGAQGGYGENAYHRASDDAYEVVNASYGVVSCCEASDFASPRLSFSRDFAMVDISTGASNRTQSSIPRLSPEKRKWEQQDDYSSDFEFSCNEPGVEGNNSNPAKGGCMLSAGELFCNGKLLPLAYPRNWISYDDLCLPSLASESSCDEQEAVKVPLCKMDNGRRSYARHLSFELARPDFSACTAPGLQASLQLPQNTSATLHTALPVHSPSSPQAKYSLRLKQMFKPKSNPNAERSPHSGLTRDDSFTSTCRFPISPRSFWPFLRNGLVCERGMDISSLACGDILDRVASSSSKGSDSSEDASKSRSLSLLAQGHVDAVTRNDSGSCSPTTEVNLLKAEHSTKSPPHAANKLAFNTVNVLDDARESIVQPAAFKLSDYGSPSILCKDRCRVTKAFARGSPGRRGGGNANKVLLRNLERCSAERKLGRDGWRGLNKRSPYPAAAFRVSPVLNVGVYKNGLFGFTNLFFSRKDKKPLEAAINWRKGA